MKHFTQIQSDPQQTQAGPVNGHKPIYFDHNGSTPCAPAVITAMQQFLEHGFGNPSSGHWASQPAREQLEMARSSVAHLIGAEPSEIVLTSGGTEANNMAIKGVWAMAARQGAHFITSAVEHDAVLRVHRFLRTQGAQVTVLPVNEFGVVDPEDVVRAIRPETVLVSIMHANNETGTLQPIAQISDALQDTGVLLHSDCAQSVGKILVDVRQLKVDMLSLAGHKFGAPNGIGALFVRKNVRIAPLLHGGEQEAGRRAGTESALLAAGLAEAAKQAALEISYNVRVLRDYFWQELSTTFGTRVALNGHPVNRVPNTLSICFPGQVGASILGQMPHVAATTGSACHAGCIDMSHVMIAMGASTEQGIGTIRFSLGKTNTMQEVDHVVGLLKAIIG